MTTPLMKDAFGHHVWATLELLDACLALDDAQLATSVPGTYGSILDTARHLVGADASYLSVTTGGRIEPIDEDAMDLAALRAQMATHDEAWRWLLDQEPDADTELTRDRPDGSSTTAPLSIRLAQALHHGTDHRSQICTALTTMGIEPPAIDVWDFAWKDGRLTEVPPTA